MSSPQGIVSLSASNTEILSALGLTEQLVGVDTSSMLAALLYPNFAERLVDGWRNG